MSWSKVLQQVRLLSFHFLVSFLCNPSLPADGLWGSFVTHSFDPHGGEIHFSLTVRGEANVILHSFICSKLGICVSRKSRDTRGGWPLQFQGSKDGNRVNCVWGEREVQYQSLKFGAEPYFNSYRLELMRTQSLSTLIIILPISAFTDSVGSVL